MQPGLREETLLRTSVDNMPCLLMSIHPPLARTPTKLTTVRIPQEPYDLIRNEVRELDVGFNTILNQILRKYAE